VGSVLSALSFRSILSWRATNAVLAGGRDRDTDGPGKGEAAAPRHAGS
jgi:hypothetical protein